jgi:hypothetical protein
MNVHFINQEKMLAAKVGDVSSSDLDETVLPVEGNADEPLLTFLGESLARIDEEDEDFSDVEYDLLEIVQDDWNPDAVTWVVTFETSWAVDDDLMVIREYVDEPLKARLPGPQSLEGETSRRAFRRHLHSGYSTSSAGSSSIAKSSTISFEVCLGRGRSRTVRRMIAYCTRNTRKSGTT